MRDLGGYALVGATEDEIDYVDSETNQNVLIRYDGESGVEMGSLIRRAAFAMRFGQIEPLISGVRAGRHEVSSMSATSTTECRALAPFLQFDADAYPVVFDGRDPLCDRRLHHDRSLPVLPARREPGA